MDQIDDADVRQLASKANVVERSILEFLHDDVLLRICRFLPASFLLGTGVTCRGLRERTQDSVELWKGLCEALLGSTTFLLHEKCWRQHAGDSDNASFYRRMFQTAWACEDFCYDLALRRTLLQSKEELEACGKMGLPDGSKMSPEPAALSVSGHTEEGIGHFVIVIGGANGETQSENVIHITVINLESRQILRPMFAADSVIPLQRMRHATCVVQIPGLVAGPFTQGVLVLGGHDGNLSAYDPNELRGGMKMLLLLELVSLDGPEIRFRELPTSGSCPEHMYNLSCASFAGGHRVCVFGGDVPRGDPEFHRISNRQNAAFVYILDMTCQHWTAVSTSGEQPSWRSFNATVSYTSLLDGRDYMVTFGGSDQHCEPLRGGRLANMCAYRLDLGTFTWTTRLSPADDFVPEGRMRFGAARWGRHLIINGGQGQDAQEFRTIRLNLDTLRWQRLVISNEMPPLHRHAFETGPPMAGCVVGCAQPGRFSGPRFPGRLMIFRLRDSTVENDGKLDGETTESADESPEADESDDDGLGMQAVQLQITGPDGRPRILQMPLAMFTALRNRATGEGSAFEEVLLDLISRMPGQTEEQSTQAGEE